MSFTVKMQEAAGSYQVAVTCPTQNVDQVTSLFHEKIGGGIANMVVNPHHLKPEATVLFTLKATDKKQALKECKAMEEKIQGLAGAAAAEDWEEVSPGDVGEDSGKPVGAPAPTTVDGEDPGTPVGAPAPSAFPGTRGAAGVVAGKGPAIPVQATASPAFPAAQTPFVTIWHEANAIFIRGPEAGSVAQYVQGHCPAGVTVTLQEQSDGGMRILCSDEGAVMAVAQQGLTERGFGVGIVSGRPPLHMPAPLVPKAPPPPVAPAPAPAPPEERPKKVRVAPPAKTPKSLEVVIKQQGPGRMVLRGGGASAAAEHLVGLYSNHHGVKLEVIKGVGNEHTIKLTPRDPKDMKAVNEMAARIVHAILVWSEGRAVVQPTEKRPFVAPLRQGVRVLSGEVPAFVVMLADPRTADGNMFNAWMEGKFDSAEVDAQANKFGQSRVVAAMQLFVQKCLTGGALQEALKESLVNDEEQHTAFREACRRQPGLLEQLDKVIPPTFGQRTKNLIR